MELQICVGDITRLNVDCIVNAANSSLMGGGGVDGAIHKAAGPKLLEECKKLREEMPDGLGTGQAVITAGYELPARYVIHTVGPVYKQEKEPVRLLEDAYRNCLDLAESYGITSIAFPAISTGAYGFPKEQAVQSVKRVIDTYSFRSVQMVVLCYFDEKDADLARRIFGKKDSHILSGIGH